MPLPGLAPGLYSRMVRPTMDLLALRGGDVPPSPGNVFAPQQELNAVSGDWRWPAAVRLLPFAAAAVILLRPWRRRVR